MDNKRLMEMSKGLKKGSDEALKTANSFNMIIFYLRLQAECINNQNQKETTIFTIEKLKEEIEKLKIDIKRIHEIGTKIGEIDYNAETEVIIEILINIEEALKKESNHTYNFLEKLRYICLNLQVGTTHMGNTEEARSINVIVEELVTKIEILKQSAALVEGSSKAVGMIISKTKEEKPKVLTK